MSTLNYFHLFILNSNLLYSFITICKTHMHILNLKEKKKRTQHGLELYLKKKKEEKNAKLKCHH